MKQSILKSLQMYFQSKIQMHQTNIECMLAAPMAIHDHTDLTGAIEGELAKMSEYEDKLAVLEKYFRPDE